MGRHSRREFISRTAGLAAALPVAFGSVARAQNSVEAPKRVIWIVVDSLRADHLHYMGYEQKTSPWLDEFASKSLNFRFAIAPSDGTVHSVPSYLCGKYFSQLYREPLKKNGVPKDERPIARLFQTADFKTFSWSTNPWISQKYGFDQGVDSFTSVTPLNHGYATLEELIRSVEGKYRRSGKREFHYVHTMDVHVPFLPPSPFDKEFVSSYTGKGVKNGKFHGANDTRVISNLPYFSENHKLAQEDIDFLLSQYDSEILYTDTYLPKLLSALDYEPFTDMVIITADHGEQFFEHGFYGHNRSTLLEELHVPLLIQFPGCNPRDIEYPVSLLDVFPTLCDVFGFNQPKGVRGRSLVPELQGAANPADYIFAEGSDDRGVSGVAIGSDMLYWLNTRNHLYLAPWKIWPMEELLFDLAKDPQCKDNMIESRPGDALRMNNVLRNLNKRLINFARPKLIGSDEGVLLGPDLFEDPGEPVEWNLSAGNFSQKTTNGVFLVACRLPSWDIGPVKVEQGAAYVFDLEYKLMYSASMELKLTQGEKGSVLWSQQFFKETKEWKTLRTVVYPDSEEIRLTCKILKAGRADMKRPSLRNAHLPEIEVVPLKASPDSLDEKGEITEEEAERLKALGYL